MGYDLNALIAEASLLARHTAGLPAAHVVPLASGLAMVPVTRAFLAGLPPDEKGGHGNAPTGFERLTPALAALAARASRDGPVAFVEAEFFGGMGTQWSVIWNNGEIIGGPFLQDLDAIDKALRALGVVRAEGRDEFDTVGLGQHRTTEGWCPA